MSVESATTYRVIYPRVRRRRPPLVRWYRRNERVADATATRPAKIFGLYPKKGAIRVGADADIVLVDPKEKHTISDAEVFSKCGWTPYAGRAVQGVPRYTFLRGTAMYDDGKVAVREGFGRQATRVT